VYNTDLLFCVVELWEFIASNGMQFWDMCIKKDAVKLRYYYEFLDLVFDMKLLADDM
jgi:hypothetical protein